MPFSGAPCREAGSAGEQDAGARHTARAGVLVPARDSSRGSGRRPPACGADRRYRARLSCVGSGVISRARCRRNFHRRSHQRLSMNKRPSDAMTALLSRQFVRFFAKGATSE